MRGLLFVSVSLLALVQAEAALATPDCSPPPTPAPQQAPAVTPETSRQSASATAGLIADRVATVVSNINVGGGTGAGTGTGSSSGDRLSAHGCATLSEDVTFDPLDQALGASTSAEADSKATPRYNAVWTGGSYNRVKKGDVNGRYDGDVKNGVVGYDRRVTKNLILGVATGYEQVDITTQYNSGSVEGESVSLSPYLGYVINNWLSVDATLGHTWIDYDFRRNGGAVKGNTKAGRWFGSTNLNATQRLGDFKLRGSVGYLRLYEQQDAYRDNTGAQVEDSQINFGQIRTTVGGSYDIATSFGVLSPNAFVRMEYDTPASQSVMVGNNWMSSSDRTGAVFGIGVDAALNNDLLFNLTATSTQFRQNTEAYSLVANLRYSF